MSNMRPIQVTKRSHIKKEVIPLPLEIIYRPGARGMYDLSACDWDEENGTGRIKFMPDGGPVDMGIADPWKMRSEFLSPDANWRGMTLRWGRFGVGSEDILEPIRINKEAARAVRFPRMFAEKFFLDTAPSLLDAEFLNWQSLVRAAMTTKMTAWPQLKKEFPPDKITRLCQPMPLGIEWRQGRPTGVIPCSGVLTALIATLQMDALIGAEYRFCACRGCPKSFKVKRRDQRYCDEDCKHRQVVRDGRDRQRKDVPQRTKRESERKSK